MPIVGALCVLLGVLVLLLESEILLIPAGTGTTLAAAMPILFSVPEKVKKSCKGRGELCAHLFLCVGLLFSAGMFHLIGRSERKHTQLDFIYEANYMQAFVERFFDSSLQIVQNFAGLYLASKEVEAGEFAEFSRLVLEDQSNVASVAWIPRVESSQRELFETEMRRTVNPSFTIHELDAAGSISPDVSKAECFPLAYHAPGGSQFNLLGLDVLGLDVSCEPNCRMVLETARRTRKPAATKLIDSLPELENRSGIIVFYPIFQKDQPGSQSVIDRERLQGFVAGVIDKSAMSRACESVAEARNIAFRLSDATDPDVPLILMSTSQDGSGKGKDFQFPCLRRSWLLTVQPTPQFLAAHTSTALALFVLLGGSGITISIFFLLTTSARHATTSERSRQRLEAAFEAAQIARQESDLLDGITQKINSGHGLHEILDYVYEGFRGVIPCDRIVFASVENDGKTLHYRWARSHSGEIPLPESHDFSMTGTSLETIVARSWPRIANDLPAHVQASPETLTGRLSRNIEGDMRSLLTCPLVAHDKPIGFLFFASSRLNAFKDKHAATFMRVANKVSITLEKARLYEQIEAKNATLELEIARRRQAEQSLSLACERQQQPFQAGGTLRHDASCYIERDADRELLAALRCGEFCYVLTSRQMGKSSLMVRTVQRLKQEQFQTFVLDLTAIGQNLTTEQWYNGLVSRIGWQSHAEDALDDLWASQQGLSPVQRFISVVRQVLLTSTPHPMVVFIDELDTVRSLPFSTNEFFAAIRECYNRRSDDDVFGRLSFCLFGTALPGDLIADPGATPFNIGRRIRLQDFAAPEVRLLGHGLGHEAQVADELMDRIFHWTQGHPYLTQRLCKAMAEDPSIRTATAVDDLCDRLFLSTRGRQEDDNLVFVRERILRSEYRRELLDLYERVRAGENIEAEPDDLLVNRLELCGLVRIESGQLRLRNRIYAEAFGPAWIRRQLGFLQRNGLKLWFLEV